MPGRGKPPSGAWQHTAVAFEVPPGADAATVSLGARFAPGAGRYAADNVFLVRE